MPHKPKPKKQVAAQAIQAELAQERNANASRGYTKLGPISEGKIIRAEKPNATHLSSPQAAGTDFAPQVVNNRSGEDEAVAAGFDLGDSEDGREWKDEAIQEASPRLLVNGIDSCRFDVAGSRQDEAHVARSDDESEEWVDAGLGDHYAGFSAIIAGGSFQAATNIPLGCEASQSSNASPRFNQPQPAGAVKRRNSESCDDVDVVTTPSDSQPNSYTNLVQMQRNNQTGFGSAR
jgi:hypothetical protein